MSTRTIYIAPDGTEHTRLPKMYNQVTPIHMGNYLSLGWTTRTEEVVIPDTDPDAITPALAAKELAFVTELVKYSNEFAIDVFNLPEININTLKTAAIAAGATQQQLTTMSANLMALTFDIMAETDKPWSVAWAALKERIPSYLVELSGTI